MRYGKCRDGVEYEGIAMKWRAFQNERELTEADLQGATFLNEKQQLRIDEAKVWTLLNIYGMINDS